MPMLDSTWKVGVVMGVAVLIRIVLHFDRGLPKNLRTSITEFVDSALIALALVFFIIRPFVIQAFYIPSRSMEDTLLINDRILVNKFIYRFRPPERGDIVVFKSPPEAAASSVQCDSCKGWVGVPKGPNGPFITFACPSCGAKISVQKDFIKRLVARSGDRVRIERNGFVWVNGVPYHEPYIKERPDYDYPNGDDLSRPDLEIVNGDVVVPPGKLFVLGDNRNDSNDSHKWGFVPEQDVLGKALLIFWSHPPDEPTDFERIGWKALLGKPRAITNVRAGS